MLSIVIPVYNEEQSLQELHRQLDEVGKQNNLQLDIVFVDDGSTDGSWAVIQNLVAEDPRISRDSLSPELRQGRGAQRRFCPGPGRVGDDARRRFAGRSGRNSRFPGA